MEPEDAAEVLDLLKEDRQLMIDTVVTYDDPIQDQSPEKFQAHLQGLVERWKSLPRESEGAGEER